MSKIEGPQPEGAVHTQTCTLKMGFGRASRGPFLQEWSFLESLDYRSRCFCRAGQLHGRTFRPGRPADSRGKEICDDHRASALAEGAVAGRIRRVGETGQTKVLPDASQADAANVRGAEGVRIPTGIEANYKRDGETLTLRALSFDDASGAYGAYTLYRQNGWPKESIGTGAASDKNRVLFWQGTRWWTRTSRAWARCRPANCARLPKAADSNGGQGA